MPKRQDFYSFQFNYDVMRGRQVRRIGARGRLGPLLLKNSLNQLMRSASFLLILITATTTATASPYTPAQIHAAVRQAGGPEKFKAELASSSAKMSGRMFDAETELVGASTLDKTLVHYVRLVNHTKAGIPRLNEVRRKVAIANAPAVCTAPIASILINEYSAVYKYIAYSKTKEYLFEYAFNRETCAANYRW